MGTGHRSHCDERYGALTGSTAANRRRRLFGVVVGTTIVAIGLVVMAIVRVSAGLVTAPTPFDLASTAVIIGLAAWLVAPLRIGSVTYPQSLVDIALMLGLMMLPTSWLLLATAASILIAKSGAGQSLQQIVFAAAKDVVVVGVSTTVGLVVGLKMPFTPTSAALPGLAAVAAAMICVEELLNTPFAVLTGDRRARDGIWVRLATATVRLGFAIAAGWLLRHNARIAIAVPMLALGLYLRYANRLEQRADQLAWQRLARIVDALGTGDESAVRRTAVLGATELFGCDEVDLVLRDPAGEASLMRSQAGAITYEGCPEEAPASEGTVVIADLERPGQGGVDVVTVKLPHRRGVAPAYTGAHAARRERRVGAGFAAPVDGGSAAGSANGNGAGPGGPGQADVLGQLRLRYRTPFALSEREKYTLHALAAALGTALRKSYAVTEAARIVMAGTHAFNHDALTGLVNRRHLLDYGGLPAGALAGMAVFDLTGFREINDTLGQAAGDRVLVSVAKRLAAGVGPGDVVARLSGDEFAVLFPHLGSAAAAVDRTRELLASLNEPLRSSGVRMTVAPVAGVAVSDDDGVEELLRRAYVALSQAKASAQSISIYVSTRDTGDVQRLALIADLPRAVASQEFATVFQAIVDLGSGDILGTEALARWPHPHLGQLPPQRFLAGIERSGLLSAFTDQILHRALAGACTWRDAGFAVPVAVNISPRSLLDPAFPDRIPDALARYGLPAEALTIEVTETLTLSQLEVVDDVLHTLRDMGVTLALDDFGTGFSSLAMIARVPVQELKIDRSFVAGMSGTTENAIVRSTIELGRALRMLVVAEGVESEEQRRRLWELGCPAGQGHLFSRPITARDLVGRLKRGYDGVPGRLVAPIHQDAQVIRLPGPRPAAEPVRAPRKLS